MFEGHWQFGLHQGGDALALRRRVFVEEKGIPEAEEFDAFDEYAAHLFLRDMDTGAPIAAGRIYPDGEDTRIGRIAVLPEYRNEPYDEFVLRVLLDKAQTLAGQRILIDADAAEEALCLPFGFRETGEARQSRGAMRKTLFVPADGVIWHSACGGHH